MKKLELNPRQLEAVRYNEGHLLILAGAGSGKTRVLTAKIAHIIRSGLAEPWRILAMTFTNKAAGEMKERVENMLPGRGRKVRMGTFHSICAWILRLEARHLGYSENFTIYDAGDQKSLVKRILKETPSAGITPGNVLSYVSRCKNQGISAGDAGAEAVTQRMKVLARIYAGYQERLEKSGAFDFDDLLTKALQLLRQNNDVRKAYASRFRYILVDEYQDTNRVQHELLKALASEGARVCVVGDDDQSIYSWRGACVENILEFEKDFPGARVVRLEENYRSTGNILLGASSLVSYNFRRRNKTLWTKRGPGAPIRVQPLFDEKDEAEWVLGEVEELVRDGDFGLDSIAILYRTNAQSRHLETACRRHGVPYEVVGSQRFYERMEIKDIVAYLRVLLNHDDRLSLERIINRPPRGLGKKGRAAFFSHLDATGRDPLEVLSDAGSVTGLSAGTVKALEKLGRWYETAAKRMEEGAPALEIVDGLIKMAGLFDQYDPGDPTDQARLENIEEFRRSVIDYDKTSPDGGLRGFMTEISLATTVDEYRGEGSGRLSLMTLHCAKGLEFDVVFVVGVEEGMLPFVRPGEYAPADIDEERRLLYVGMTRAREMLVLTYAANRKRAGVRFLGPSRFIKEIAAGQSGMVPAGDDSSPVERKSTVEYRPGNLVEHPRYGKGIVRKVMRNGSEWKIVVDFGFDEPKTLVTGYVPIPVLKERAEPGDLD